MTNEVKNVPEIRFPEFSGEWEENKLNNYLKTSKIKNTQKKYNKQDVLSVSGDFGIVNQIEFQGRSFAGASVAPYGIVETGDIVYTKSPLKSSPYGIIKVNKGESGIVSTLYAIYKIKKNVDANFVEDYFTNDLRLNKYLKPLVNKGAKNDMKVSDDNALIGDVIFPKYIEEQIKISKFFSKLDRQIELEEQKLSLLEEQKKGYMQKVFSQELRFKDENGEDYSEWEEKKLGEVASVYDGTHQTPKYTNEGIKFLSVENIKTLKSNKYISKEAFDKEFKIRPEFGDVLMTRIGDVGTTNVVNSYDDLAYYVSLALLKPKNMNSYFLASLIQSPKIQNELWRKTLHIAFPKKINKNEIAKVIVNHPKKQEQEKIGNFFRSFDEFLEKQNQKIDGLKKRKKGFLQKMFV